MNAKIMRVNREIDKTKEKISEQQARLRELERQKTELENLDIVSTVRGMNISFTDLAELLKNIRPDASGTLATSGHVDPKSGAALSADNEAITTDNEQEDETL